MKLAELTIGESYAFGSRDQRGKIIRHTAGVFQGVESHRGINKAKFEIVNTWLSKAGEIRYRMELVAPQQVLGTLAEIEAEEELRQREQKEQWRAREAFEARQRENREKAYNLRRQETARLEALLNGYRVEFNGSWVITLPEGVDSLTTLLNRLEA